MVETPLHVPPHFEPTKEKLGFELEPDAGGGLLLRVTASQGKGTTVRVGPDGVTVTTPGVIRKAGGEKKEYGVERIIDVRRATATGVCLTVREADGSWRRVLLPVLNAAQKHGSTELLQLATPWLAGEIARVVGRPALVDAYVTIPNWVDRNVEEAGRQGQLLYGAAAGRVDYVEAVPPVVRTADGAHPGERMEIPPRPIPHRNITAVAVVCGIAWVCVVGVCAGMIGARQAYIPAAMFGIVAGVLLVLHVVDEVLGARQQITVVAEEGGWVDVEVRRGFRRRRRRLTREETKAVYVTPGRRWRRVMRSRPRGADQTLLRGIDPAVARTVTGLIERHLGLESTEGVSNPSGGATPVSVTPVAPVGAPSEGVPAGWTLQEESDGPGTWTVTRPAASGGEKARTGGCFLMVLGVTAAAAFMFPGRGPVPGIVGIVVGGFGLLLLAGRVERVLGPATVRYDGAAVHVAHRGLFGRVRHRVEVWSIERVLVGVGAVTEGKHLTATAQLQLRNGQLHNVIGLVGEADARWLARKLAHSLNMAEEVRADDTKQGPEV